MMNWISKCLSFIVQRSALIVYLSRLHRLLLICKRDVHLFKSDLVKCTCNLDTLCTLIFPQAIACRSIKLPCLFSCVKPALLENRLRLLDLILVGSENRAALSVCVGVSGR